MTPQEQKQMENEHLERKEAAEKVASRSWLIAMFAFLISIAGVLALLGIFGAGIYQIFNWITA